jgi:dsRNA-gated channel SID-1-like protein
LSRKSATSALLAVTVVVIAAAVLSPSTPQPLSYHNFADQRSWLGIPNFGDVASNLAFAIFGAWGLWFLLRLAPQESSPRFADPRERWFYIAVFFGMLLTAIGSSYYHLAPDNDRLVWDRLPMTIVFMSLVAAMIAERISVRAALWLWPILIAIGILSVLQWHWSEQAGHGDLRFYAAVQVYAVLVLLLVLFLPTRYTHSSYLGVVVAFYVLAKLLETFDKQVFALGHIISGHTLKHIVAGLAGYWILRMLQKREVRPKLKT